MTFYTTDHRYFVAFESLGHILAYKVIYFDLSLAKKMFPVVLLETSIIFFPSKATDIATTTIELKFVKSVVLRSCWPRPYMAGQFLLLSLAELAADMILLVAYLIFGVTINFGGSFWSTSSGHRNTIEMV